MAAKRMERLLRLRKLEEEQRLAAFEASLNELRRLERELTITRKKDRTAREWMNTRAGDGGVADRQAGIVESRTAAQKTAALNRRITAVQTDAVRLRTAMLEKRAERRQVETLVREALAQEMAETGRKEQKQLDEWFRTRTGAEPREADPNPGLPRQVSGKDEKNLDAKDPLAS